jgi:hypothetical protein
MRSAAAAAVASARASIRAPPKTSCMNGTRTNAACRSRTAAILVALAAFHQRPYRRRGVLAAIHKRHRPVGGGALHKAERLLGRPVGSVRMALRRDDEGDLATSAGAVLDFLEQQRR